MRGIFTAALLVTASTGASAQQAPVHQYGALAIAPKGDRLASIEAASPTHAAIVVRRVSDGGVAQTIDPCPTCSYGGPTFAADGRIAFVARKPGEPRALVMVADAGGARQVATIDGIAQAPRFSPDGKRLALLATFGAAKEAGATQAGVRQVGEIGETSDEQRLAIVDIAAGTVKPVSPADRYIYE